MASNNRKKHARYVEHVAKSGPVEKIKPVDFSEGERGKYFERAKSGIVFDPETVEHHEKWCMSWFISPSSGKLYPCNCHMPEPREREADSSPGGEE